MHKTYACHLQSRQAFTLVEIVFTIGLIALLTTMLVIAVGPALSSAKAAATRNTISMIGLACQDRFADYGATMEQKKFKDRVTVFKARFDNANPMVSLPVDVATTIVASNDIKSLFPQRLEDLWGYDGVQDSPPGAIDDAPMLKAMWDTTANNWKVGSWRALNGDQMTGRQREDQKAAESAELLYLALQQVGLSEYGNRFDISSIPSAHIGDTDQDGNLEFLDAWGQPLQFYNMPTRLYRPNGIAGTQLDSCVRLLVKNYGSVDQDPFDRIGKAADSSLISSNFQLQSPNSMAMAFGETWYRTPKTTWQLLIVSGGPDEALGLELPNSSTSNYSHLCQPLDANLSSTVSAPHEALFDNLSNLQK